MNQGSNPEEDWPKCTRCGSEYPRGINSYIVTAVVGTVGLKVKANENPMRIRKGGVCKRCTAKLVRWLEGGE